MVRTGRSSNANYTGFAGTGSRISLMNGGIGGGSLASQTLSPSASAQARTLAYGTTSSGGDTFSIRTHLNDLEVSIKN